MIFRKKERRFNLGEGKKVPNSCHIISILKTVGHKPTVRFHGGHSGTEHQCPYNRCLVRAVADLIKLYLARVVPER